MDKLQYLNDNPLPFARLLGLKFVAASETGVTAEMVVRPDLCTRPDILHGGAVMAFADTLGAAAVQSGGRLREPCPMSPIARRRAATTSDASSRCSNTRNHR